MTEKTTTEDTITGVRKGTGFLGMDQGTAIASTYRDCDQESTVSML